MPTPPRSPDKIDVAIKTWPLVRDAGAFALGSFMLVWQTVFEESAQDILVLTGFGALGIAGSGIAQRLLQRRIDAQGEEPPA